MGGSRGTAAGQIERTGGRYGEAAGALDEAASVLDLYADAVEDTRAEVDRLNAQSAQVQQDHRLAQSRVAVMAEAEAVVAATRRREAEEAVQFELAALRDRHDGMLGRLASTAARLGARLEEIAERAYPAGFDPNRGPAEVVRQNADDSGDVDWVTHIAMTHPHLTVEQRLWILEHPDELRDEYQLQLEIASFPPVTDSIARNYTNQMADRNSAEHLGWAFEHRRIEFLNALVLPMVVATITSVEFRQAQRDAQLFVAIVDAATAGPPPAQFIASPVLPLGLGVPRRFAEYVERISVSPSASWGRPETLVDHFGRHGAGVGAGSANDYAMRASAFFQRGIRQGLPTRVDQNGVIRIYDPLTNTFGAYNADGTTRSFFRPSSSNYWANQPGVDI